MEHTYKYTVEFGEFDITARVTVVTADAEPKVAVLSCTRYGRPADVTTLNQEDMLNAILYHHDMMQSEPSDNSPEPFVDAWGELVG